MLTQQRGGDSGEKQAAPDGFPLGGSGLAGEIRWAAGPVSGHGWDGPQNNGRELRQRGG